MYVWPNVVNRSASSARRISINHPRSSGITRRTFVRTPWMRGALAIVAVYWFGSSTAIASPSDADLRIVSQHEAIRARLHRLAPDADVPADEAVDDAVRQVAHARSLEHDAVLDLGILDLDVVADRGERPDVGVHDAGAAADDGGAANRRPFDHRPLLDDDLPLDAALRIDHAVDPALERLEDQPVRLEHVLELAGVLPPPLDDVRADGEAAVDQVLDGVGDLELVAEARRDPVHRLEDLGPEHVHADEREIADRLLRLFDETNDPAVVELRGANPADAGSRSADVRRRAARPCRCRAARRRTSADREPASAGFAPPASARRTRGRTGRSLCSAGCRRGT